MKTSFLELRTKSKQILRAIDQNEEIIVTYRGKPKAVIRSIQDDDDATARPAGEHEAFGLWADREDMSDVALEVRKMRKGRFDAL